MPRGMGGEGGERRGRGRETPVPNWESEKVATLILTVYCYRLHLRLLSVLSMLRFVNCFKRIYIHSLHTYTYINVTLTYFFHCKVRSKFFFDSRRYNNTRL